MAQGKPAERSSSVEGGGRGKGGALGEFLRARRQQVGPEELGLPAGGSRRVAGLRREEVALLAGVSTDYYVRLEQGRERNPSAQVVDALARGLALDDDAVAHLHRLARPEPVRRRRARRREQVSPNLLRLMDGWPDTPALVLGRCLDVLAHNTLGQALFAGHTHSGDLIRLVFLDPDAREFYPDWERVAVNTVGGLRAAAGIDPDDPQLIDTVGELSVKSADFRRLWARHEVRPKAGGRKRMVSPAVGEVPHRWETFAVTGAPGQLVVASFPLLDDPASVIAFERIAQLTRERAARAAGDRP